MLPKDVKGRMNETEQLLNGSQGNDQFSSTKTPLLFDTPPLSPLPLISENPPSPAPSPLETSMSRFIGQDSPFIAQASACNKPCNTDSEYAIQLRANPKVIIPVISIGTFLCAMDQTVIVSLNPLIGSQLQALDLASWVATVYFLTLSCVQPAYGKLCDVFGRKECLLFCYMVFGLGCALCGLAQTMTQLILARVIQGIGGAGMPTIESVIVSDIVPQKDRGLWQGFINLVFTIGCASGSLLGSLVAESIGWRWVFLSQVPLCLFAVVVCTTLLELPDFTTRPAGVGNDGDHDDANTVAAVGARPQSSRLAAIRRVDFLGMALLAAAIATLIYGLQHGGSVAWASPVTAGCLAASAAGFALYLVVEAMVAAEPVTPCRLLFARALLPPYLCTLFGFAAWMAVLFYIPLFFQARYNEDVRVSACRLLLAQVGVLAGSFGAGWAMRRAGRYYWITVTGYAWYAASLVVSIVGMMLDSSVTVMAGGMMVGIGTGCSIVTSLLGLITNASAEDMATVTAINYLMRSIGSGVGVSVASTVVQNSLRWGIAAALELDKEQAETIADGARKDLEFIGTLPDALQLVVRRCYGLAVRDSTIAMLVMIMLALISSFFFREKKFST